MYKIRFPITRSTCYLFLVPLPPQNDIIIKSRSFFMIYMYVEKKGSEILLLGGEVNSDQVDEFYYGSLLMK